MRSLDLELILSNEQTLLGTVYNNGLHNFPMKIILFVSWGYLLKLNQKY